ncbi:MAG: copper amine oxidase N-terminal domain-containing protein [Armatimonadota bacterium]|nr:copper amine oxidase N-terminal domain-containing protein [Armatimonadota bacterium]
MKSLIVLSIVGLTTSAPQTVVVYISGQPLGGRAIIVDGKAYLPVRAVAENLQANVDYDIGQRRITITRQGRPTEQDLFSFAIRNGLPTSHIITQAKADSIVQLIIRNADTNKAGGRRIIDRAYTWRKDVCSVWESSSLAHELESEIQLGNVEFDDKFLTSLNDLGMHTLMLATWHERP